MAEKESKRCIKCKNKLTNWNTSVDKELCKKCYRPSIGDSFKGILILVAIIFIVWLFWPSSSNSDSSQNLAKFEPELTSLGGSLTTYKVINRNDYAWHNVEIIVNDYYSCWSRAVVESGESITISAATCNDFAVNYNSVNSLLIEADEGVERRSLR